MSTFSQSPPGRRLASYQGAPNRSCNFRGSMNRLPSIRGKRKHGFFKSKFYSSSSSDDFSKNSVDHQAQLYAIPSNHSKNENNPPGVAYVWMANNKHSEVHFSSISIFRTQVVSKSLPSRDTFKTFICKGLFTTHQAIQKGSLRSPMEKAHLEPLVAWFRFLFRATPVTRSQLGARFDWHWPGTEFANSFHSYFLKFEKKLWVFHH